MLECHLRCIRRRAISEPSTYLCFARGRLLRPAQSFPPVEYSNKHQQIMDPAGLSYLWSIHAGLNNLSTMPGTAGRCNRKDKKTTLPTSCRNTEQENALQEMYNDTANRPQHPQECETTGPPTASQQKVGTLVRLVFTGTQGCGHCKQRPEREPQRRQKPMENLENP